jgi:hypothetical protein
MVAVRGMCVKEVYCHGHHDAIFAKTVYDPFSVSVNFTMSQPVTTAMDSLTAALKSNIIPNQEYLLQGSVLDSAVEVLLHRLRGLCDNVDSGPETFHDHEMCFSIRTYIYTGSFKQEGMLGRIGLEENSCDEDHCDICIICRRSVCNQFYLRGGSIHIINSIALNFSQNQRSDGSASFGQWISFPNFQKLMILGAFTTLQIAH